MGSKQNLSSFLSFWNPDAVSRAMGSFEAIGRFVHNEFVILWRREIQMALELRGVVPLLWVYDMPTSIRFYRDALGFKVAATSAALGEDQFDWAMLELGQCRFMLNAIFESDQPRPIRLQPSAPSQRDVWLYFDCPDVDAIYQTLHGKGLGLQEPSVTYYGTYQTFLHDPDGYRLCFQSPSNG
jgi:glyoxylase I family protein